MNSLVTGLITSKTRIRVLMRLFINPEGNAHLRELAEEMSVSPSQVKEELRQLSAAGLIASERRGRQIHYRANPRHPLFPELHSMVRKALGMDRILDSIIDPGLVGDIDHANLADLVRKTERYIGRKIRTLVLSREEHERLQPVLGKRPLLPLWARRGPPVRKTGAA